MTQQQDEAQDTNTTTTNSNNSSSTSPRPTKSQVQSCQFSSWYPTFRNIPKSSLINNPNTTSYKLRKNVTIESSIIRPLPLEFIEYLLSDGVRLPLCAMRVSSCLKDDITTADDDDDWNDNDDDNNNDSSSEEEEIQQYNFPTLTNQIQTSITQLGNKIMPKLNWSSPKDATWMNCGTLKCTTVGDVYLLLKSSEFVGFDLERAWLDLDSNNEDESNDESNNDGEETTTTTINNENETIIRQSSSPPNNFEYELVLRKWCNLHPSMEFRCFVYNHQLIGISQRHATKFYTHLQPPNQEEELHHPISNVITSFHETYVQHRFNDGKMDRYVMDVYVDSQERVWIVDFNVWARRTDALLFDWDELIQLAGEQQSVGSKSGGDDHNDNCNNENGEENNCQEANLMPEWRVVTKDMKDLTYDPLSSFRGPTDVMNLMGGGGNNEDGGFDATSFKDFMEQCVRPSEM